MTKKMLGRSPYDNRVKVSVILVLEDVRLLLSMKSTTIYFLLAGKERVFKLFVVLLSFYIIASPNSNIVVTTNTPTRGF